MYMKILDNNIKEVLGHNAYLTDRMVFSGRYIVGLDKIQPLVLPI